MTQVACRAYSIPPWHERRPGCLGPGTLVPPDPSQLSRQSVTAVLGHWHLTPMTILALAPQIIISLRVTRTGHCNRVKAVKLELKVQIFKYCKLLHTSSSVD